jgi:hypothetical protein
MARKIFSGILIALSSILLLSSVVGIGAAWYYNEPLTSQSVARLGEIETELARTQTALQDAKAELERTLRIVDSAEVTLKNVTDELAQAKKMFDEFDKTLGDNLIPGLESSRDRLASLRGTLEDLRAQLAELNSLPFLDLNLPGDEVFGNLIDTVSSIDGQIGRMRGLADKASTFAEDVSFLMGGDFSETRKRLETFVQVVGEYEQKVGGWHAQVQSLIAAVPGWIDRASIILTIFLSWFGLSQFGLLLHGLALWRGGDPLLTARREPVPALPPPDEAPLATVEKDELIVAEELDEGDKNPEITK